MSTIFLNNYLQPKKLGFLISPNNLNQLQNAISITSCLWGGMYNPLIPFFKRKPRDKFIWDDQIDFGKDTIFNKYMNLFDPDELVITNDLKKEKIIRNYSSVDSSKLKGRIFEEANRRQITCDEIYQYIFLYPNATLTRSKKVINNPWRNENTRIIDRMFLGFYDASICALLSKKFPDELIINDYKITDFLNKEIVSPLSISNYKLDTEFRNLRIPYFFLMNYSNFIDLIDYWNIRALGFDLYPISDNEIRNDQFIIRFKSLLEKEVNRNNITPFSGLGVFFSRKINLKESFSLLKELSRKIGESYDGLLKPLRNPFLLSEESYYCRNVYSIKRSFSIETEIKESNIKIQKIIPEFVSDSSSIFKNTIKFSNYSGNYDFASAFPFNNHQVADYLNIINFNKCRISKRGICFFVNSVTENILIKKPVGKEVISVWLKSEKCKSNLSDKGLIAYEMTKLLGDEQFSASLIRNEALIKFFNKFANNKTITKDQCFSELENIINSFDKNSLTPKILLEKLININSMRLGVKIKCPVCSRSNWYAINEIDYQVICKTCLQEISFPIILSKEERNVEWAYRTIGPFGLGNSSDGSYSLLLTSRFFRLLSNYDYSESLSINTEILGEKIEIDLCILMISNGMINHGRYEENYLFIECKSKHRFENKDLMKMELIRRKFPNSYLVFSSLNDYLTVEEKKRFLRVFKKYLKIEDGKKYLDRIILLMNNDLLNSDNSFSHWKKSKISSQEIHKIFKNDLAGLSKITQLLYLN